MPTGVIELPQLSLDETLARIAARKAELGKRVLILGHHYQVEEVVRFADYTGDSFKLARIGAEHPEADYPSHPQWETGEVATAMERHFERVFPVVHSAFNRHGRVCP